MAVTPMIGSPVARAIAQLTAAPATAPMPSDVEDAKRVSTSEWRTSSATFRSVFPIWRSLAAMLVNYVSRPDLLVAETPLSWIKAPSPRLRAREPEPHGLSEADAKRRLS